MMLGGPACLSDYNEMDDVHSFFNLLEEFDKDSKTFNAHLLLEKMNRLYSNPKQCDAQLQIMTIHAAKGLEFDHVILPHLERKTLNDDKPLLLWMERPLLNHQIALMISPHHGIGGDKNPIYDYIDRQHKIRTDHEMDRLLYVAATRAKKSLYLFFNVKTKDNHQPIFESGSFLSKLSHLIPSINDQNIFSNDSASSTEIENRKPSRKLTRLQTTWKNPIQEQIPSNFAVHQQEGFEWKDNMVVMIGITVHRILKWIGEKGIAWWQTKDNIQQNMLIRYLLVQSGLDISKCDEANARVFQAISQTLNDQKGQWILYPHHDGRCEFAVTTKLDDDIVNLVIDRTFVADDTRWIIDYKTTFLTQKDSTVFLEKEKEKYLEKMNLYQHAMQQIDHHPIRLALYFPLLSLWHEF